LTAQQRESLHETERHLRERDIASEDIDRMLLDYARKDAETNLTDLAYADVAVPPGASVDGEGWEQSVHGEWSRPLIWRRFDSAGGVGVDIDGRQKLGGSFTRQISLYADNGASLNAAQAREIAALLIAAADEFDRMME